MIPENVKEILKHEGVVAIATQGKDGPHLINTWHSYIQLTEVGNILVPVGGMQKTEGNLQKDNRVLVTLGSRDVLGKRGPGAGFLLTGTARILTSGNGYDIVKKKFVWARAALEITIDSSEQTI
jgi:predicted pyridoxine 5'-phosphate oxidase superfamily flavin-nucleotide-binding protein